MGEGLVLTMDGSTSVCCAALLEVSESNEAGVGRMISRRSETNGRGQARILLRQIEEMLSEVGAERRDLRKLIVGTGPGTFTGVRIAVATARGLSLALGVPVFGASTLSALAAWAIESATDSDRRSWSDVVPVVDARRGQVFYAIYDSDTDADASGDSRWVRHGPVAVCDHESFTRELRELRPGITMVIVGEDDVIGQWTGDSELLASSVRSEYLALGQKRLVEASHPTDRSDHTPAYDRDARIGTPESVKPIYVRAPDADIHITKMRDPWARKSSRG